MGKTLKEYINGLQKFLAEHPEAADYQVVTAIDDEGNGFNHVSFEPTIGYYDGEDFADDSDTRNAVCVN